MQDNLFTCISLSSVLIGFLCLNGKRQLIIAMETVRRAALRSMLACNSEANNTAPQSVFIHLQCPNGGDEAG